MANFLTRLFGSRNQRLLRQYSKLVKKINSLEEGLQALSDADLKAKTDEELAAVIDEATRATEEGKEKTILFCLSGHGLLDLKGYEMYFAGNLENYPLPEEVLARSIAVMEGHPKP